ncbi:LOW QUALITY PROTEIN: nucleolar protein 9 [Rhinoraja longicauda]
MERRKEPGGPGPPSAPGPAPGPARADGATLAYCRRLGQTLERGFEGEEEKGLFLTNVLEEIEGEELLLCTDPSASVFLERLVEQCDGPPLCRVLSALAPLQGALAVDRCGSHVLQSALRRAAGLWGEAGGRGALAGLVVRLSGAARDEFTQLARDVYGSFHLRSLLHVLAGTLPPAAGSHRDNPRNRQPHGPDHSAGQAVDFDAPEDFLQELRHFTQLLKENLTVAVQLLSRKLPACAQELCSAVLKYRGASGQAEKHGSLLVYLKDRAGSRLLEGVIGAMDVRLYRRFYRRQLRGRLGELALHPVGNYPLQRALGAGAHPELFLQMLGELLPLLEEVLTSGHPGVLVELAAGCARHHGGQKELRRALYQALHCDQPRSRRVLCLPLVVTLQTYESFYGEGAAEPGTDLQPVTLLTLACDPAGSHVYDALFTSGTVSNTQQTRLTRKLASHTALILSLGACV